MQRLKNVWVVVLVSAGFIHAQADGQRRAVPETPGGPRQMRTGRQMEGMRRRMQEQGGSIDEGGLFMRLLNRPEFMEEIGISDRQADALRDHMLDIDVLRQQLETEHREAARQHMELMQNLNASEEELMQSVERLGKMRIRMAKLQVKRIMAVRATLSPTQIAKAREKVRESMERQRERRMEEGRRRPPGDEPTERQRPEQARPGRDRRMPRRDQPAE